MPFLSPEDQQIFETQITDKVNSLSDLQVRMIVSAVIGQQKEASEGGGVEENFIQLKNLWSSEKIEGRQVSSLIKKTMNSSFEYFEARGLKKDSLKYNSDFSRYIKSGYDANPVEVSKIMYDFCDYLAHLSSKTPEQQRISLESFPPQAGYLACLIGTQERIDELKIILTAEEEHEPFLKAHKVTIYQATDALKHEVAIGNHVHIPKYLEYSLGLGAERVIFPQSQIALTSSLKIHQEYCSNFKEILNREMLEIFRSRIDSVRTVVENIGVEVEAEGHPSFDPLNFDAECQLEKVGKKRTRLIHLVNTRLNGYEIDGIGFVKSLDESSNFCLDQDLLKTFPALNFLDKTLQQEKMQLLQAENQQAEELQIFNSEDVFFDRGIERILELLKITEGVPVNHQDLLMGLETLWMMGDELRGKCPIPFLQTMVGLNEFEPDYLNKKIAPEIAKFLPDQIEKIERIKRCVDTYMTNPRFIDPNASMADLLLGNASSEELVRPEYDSVQSLVSGLRLIVKDGSRSEICANLMGRSDYREILFPMKDTLGALGAISHHQETIMGAESPLKISVAFVKGCLSAAARGNNLEGCQFLLENLSLVPRDEMLKRISVFCSAAKNNNAEMMDYFIKFVGADAASKAWLDQHEYSSGELDTAASLAAKLNHADVIETMVGAGIPLSELNMVSLSGLKSKLSHVAAKNGSGKVMQYLLERGDDVTSLNNEGFSPVHLAAMYGHANIIDILKSAGVDKMNFELLSMEAWSPLEYAVFNGRSEVVESLSDQITSGLIQWDRILNGLLHTKSSANLVQPLMALGSPAEYSEINGSVLSHWAIESDRPDLMAEFIKIEESVDFINARGNAAIHLVANKPNPDFLKILVKEEANLNLKNQRGDAAIHIALNNANLEMAVGLMDCGADMTLVGADNLNPFQLAESLKMPRFIYEMDRRGIGVEENIDQRGGNWMHRAACNSIGYKAVNSLFGQGVNFQKFFVEDVRGYDPLEIAAWNKQSKAITAFRDGGIDLNQDNENGMNLVSKMIFRSKLDDQNISMVSETIKLVVDCGFDINRENRYGDSPLHVAVQRNNALGIRVLKAIPSIDLNKTNAKGDTPLYLAACGQCLESVEQLLDAESLDQELRKAINNNEDVAVNILLKVGSNILSKEESLVLKEGLKDYLNEAVKIGSLKLAKVFIKYGAAIDDQLDDESENELSEERFFEESSWNLAEKYKKLNDKISKNAEKLKQGAVAQSSQNFSAFPQSSLLPPSSIAVAADQSGELVEKLSHVANDLGKSSK